MRKAVVLLEQSDDELLHLGGLLQFEDVADRPLFWRDTKDQVGCRQYSNLEFAADRSETRVVNSVEPAILCRLATAEATINEIGADLMREMRTPSFPRWQ